MNREVFRCPANPNHKLSDTIKQMKHIMRCKEMIPYKTVYVCGYHKTHLFLSPEERKNHYKSCTYSTGDFQETTFQNHNHDPKIQPYKHTKHISEFYQKNKARLKAEEKLTKERKWQLRQRVYDRENDPVHLIKSMQSIWNKQPFIYFRVDVGSFKKKFALANLKPHFSEEDRELLMGNRQCSYQPISTILHVKEIKQISYYPELDKLLKEPVDKRLIFSKIIGYFNLILGENEDVTLKDYFDMVTPMQNHKLVLPFTEKNGAKLAFVHKDNLGINPGNQVSLVLLVYHQVEASEPSQIEHEEDTSNGKDSIPKQIQVKIREPTKEEIKLSKLKRRIIELKKEKERALKPVEKIQKIILRLQEKAERRKDENTKLLKGRDLIGVYNSRIDIIEEYRKHISSLTNKDSNRKEILYISFKQSNIDQNTMYRKENLIELTKKQIEKLKNLIEKAEETLKQQKNQKQKLDEELKKFKKVSNINKTSRKSVPKPAKAPKSTQKEEKEEEEKYKFSPWSKLPMTSKASICNVCYERRRSIIFPECRHTTMCWVCAKSYNEIEPLTCNICRAGQENWFASGLFP